MGYRRLGAAATGVGAASVVALFMLSMSVANAGVASFPTGTYWYPFKFVDVEGCAQAHGYPPKFNLLTGHGSEKDSTSAKTCPTYRGGNQVYSLAELENEFNLVSHPALTSSNNGINVTWDLKALVSVNGGLSGSMACPTTNYSYSNYYNYTPYYNYTYSDASIYGNCEAGANMEVIASGYMEGFDSSGNFAADYFPGEFFNFSDAGVENLTDWYSYSLVYTWVNTSYYPSGLTGYSYSGSFNTTLNNTGSSFTLAATPTLYYNATGNFFGAPTFNSTYTYTMDNYVDVFTESLAFGFTGSAHGAASINMAGTTHHMNLHPFVFW